MSKKKVFIISGGLLAVAVLAAAALAGNGTEAGKAPADQPAAAVSASADLIEVVHFHATRQCYSCVTAGKYALETIQERFPEEYQSGRIVFKDVNGELPENYDMVTRYQARGSSLFVNALSGGQDNIKEDTAAWRLVGNEQAFKDHFEKQLRELL